MGSTHWLSMIAGHKVGQRFEISTKQGTIGRGPSNAIQVIDAEVSRIHCRYLVVGNSLELADLESANGTLVNGKTVDHCRLGDGDKITVGSTVFEVEINDVADEQIADSGFAIHGKLPAHELPSSLSYFPVTNNLFGDSPDGEDPGSKASDSVQMANVVSDMSFIYNASLVTSSKTERGKMLNGLIDLIFDWIEADRCGFLLLDSDTGKFVREAMRSRGDDNGRANLVISQSIVKYVSDHRVGILTSNALEDQRLSNKDSIKQIGVREAICVPINGLSLIHISEPTRPY